MADNLRRSLVAPACLALLAWVVFTGALPLGIALALSFLRLPGRPADGRAGGLVPTRPRHRLAALFRRRHARPAGAAWRRRPGSSASWRCSRPDAARRRGTRALAHGRQPPAPAAVDHRRPGAGLARYTLGAFARGTCRRVRRCAGARRGRGAGAPIRGRPRAVRAVGHWRRWPPGGAANPAPRRDPSTAPERRRTATTCVEAGAPDLALLRAAWSAPKTTTCRPTTCRRTPSPRWPTAPRPPTSACT